VVEEEPLQVRIHAAAGRLPLPPGWIDEPLLPEPVRFQAGRRTTRVRVEIRFGRRGRRKLAPPSLVLRDPFGLAQRVVRGEHEDELLVLPRTYPVNVAANGGEAQPAHARAALIAAAEPPARACDAPPPVDMVGRRAADHGRSGGVGAAAIPAAGETELYIEQGRPPITTEPLRRQEGNRQRRSRCRRVVEQRSRRPIGPARTRPRPARSGERRAAGRSTRMTIRGPVIIVTERGMAGRGHAMRERWETYDERGAVADGRRVSPWMVVQGPRRFLHPAATIPSLLEPVPLIR
jgi:hypothetical protein